MPTTFLQSFDEKEDAQKFRDEMRELLLEYEITPQATVGVRRMHGVGGFAVELEHHNTDMLAIAVQALNRGASFLR